MPPLRYLKQTFIKKKDLPGLLWVILVLFFIFSMVNNPKAVFEGATTGLNTWWNVLLPALLPFFIASELLMKLGVVHFIGMLLEPIMRPLFNIPGAGGFVMVMAITSGSPVNAMLTAKLRQEGVCTKNEAGRILSFTNFSSPFFMLTAVAVGMFSQPELGLIIAGAHYLANFSLGIILSFFGDKSRKSKNIISSPLQIIKQAFYILIKFQRKEKKTIGQLLGDAVATSVVMVINIGGFIVLFSVIIKLLSDAEAMVFITSALSFILAPLNFSSEVLASMAKGFFETTIGIETVTQTSAPQLQKLMTIGILLGFSGLSVIAQVITMIKDADIGLGLFFLSRLVQGGLAALFTVLLYNSERVATSSVLPVFEPLFNHSQYSLINALLSQMGAAFFLLSLLLFLALFFQVFIYVYSKLGLPQSSKPWRKH